MMRLSRRATTYRALSLVLLAWGAVGILTTEQAAAHSSSLTSAVAPASQSQSASCVIHSLPSFVAQGEFASTATVADVIEVECNPFLYGTGAEVTITAAQLYSRCHEVSWYIPNEHGAFRKAQGSSVNLHLDVDGNANVGLIAGPNCMVGESLITLDENESPYETFTTSFQVLPTTNTPQGVYATPAAQVEDAESSGVVTIVQAEFNGAGEAKVRLAAAQLYNRCEKGEKLIWVRENREMIPGRELVGAHAVELDNNGNGFALAIGSDSCAEGKALIEGDLEESPFTTETTNFTVLPPQPTEEPSFTIEKSQEIKGGGAGFTTTPLMGKIGQTVDYEIVVKNTAHVSETFSDLSDPQCDHGTISGGPGSSAVAPGESTTYTCDHVLTAVGSYTNEAMVTGNSVGGRPVRHTSNQVVVVVPSEPGFSIEKLQEILGSGFTSAPLSGVLGETVKYEIVVKNTGNVPLTFSSFSDAHCDASTIAGGPGAALIAPGALTTYTCDHVLTSAGSYVNEATLTGTAESKPPITQTSNKVEVTVPREPGFTIEKLQEILGSGFTSAPLSGVLGETVKYEIVVKNTGNVPLAFSSFTDAHCDASTIAGGPGPSPVAPGGSTTYTCSHVLTSAGSYVNEATLTGTPEGEAPILQTSNKVEVTVPATKSSPTEQHPGKPGGGVGSLTTPTPSPKGEVLAICETSAPLQGASGPKRQAFTVQTSSAGIKQITFYLDGRKLKTLKQSQAKRGRFTIKINPLKLSYGAHKLLTKTVMSNPHCKAPAHPSVFVRPVSERIAPKFTG